MMSPVDEGRAADVVYLDASKAFKTVSHNSLIDKLMKYKLGKWTVRWTEQWLNCQTQRVEIGNTKSSWRPGTSRVPQWPILLNTSMSDPNNGIECKPSNMADCTKLGGEADTAEGCAAIQRNLNILEKWAIRSYHGIQQNADFGMWGGITPCPVRVGI